MIDDHNSYMGWNPPRNGPNGSKDSRPSSEEQPRSTGGGSNNDEDNIWTRKRKPNNSPEQWLKKINSLLSGGGNGSNQNLTKKSGFKGLLTLGLVVLIGFYVFTGFYTVREAERGVVLRFGKFYEVVEPGLQWKFTGIDQVTMVDIEQVRAIQSSGSMLTEDENVVIVEMDVQYRISNPTEYLYSVTNPDNSLMEATDSALRFVVGHNLMDDILTSGREKVRQDTRELLNSIIEPYHMGLSIVDVNFLPARAPDEVKEAFDDAIAAQEDEQRFKREAEAYANEVLPRAEGQVQRIRQEAEAYRSQVVLDAQGQVARFEQILPEFNAAPEITRTRLYLETLEKVLGSSSKIILDTPEGSTPVLYLPMPTNQGATGQQAAAASSVPNSNMSSVTSPVSTNTSQQTAPYYNQSSYNHGSYNQGQGSRSTYQGSR